MEVPQPLTNEEIGLLSEETREIYRGITHLDITRHYTEYYDAFYDGVRVVLSELLPKMNISNPELREKYLNGKMRSFGAFFINSVIVHRNELVTSKRDVRQALHRLKEGLDKVILEPRDLNIGGMDVHFGTKLLMEKANEIVKLIDADIPKVPQYVNAYYQSKKKFDDLKADYESKSRFGRIMASITGEKRRLDRAEDEYRSFDRQVPLDELAKDTYNGKVTEEYRFKGIERVGKHL